MKVSPALKDRALLRRVLGLVGPYWFFVVSSLICAAVSVAAQLLVPILCGDAIDAMLGMGRVDFSLVGRVAFAIALSTAIAAAAQWVLAACNNRISPTWTATPPVTWSAASSPMWTPSPTACSWASHSSSPASSPSPVR